MRNHLYFIFKNLYNFIIKLALAELFPVMKEGLTPTVQCLLRIKGMPLSIKSNQKYTAIELQMKNQANGKTYYGMFSKEDLKSSSPKVIYKVFSSLCAEAEGKYQKNPFPYTYETTLKIKQSSNVSLMIEQEGSIFLTWRQIIGDEQVKEVQNFRLELLEEEKSKDQMASFDEKFKMMVVTSISELKEMNQILIKKYGSLDKQVSDLKHQNQVLQSKYDHLLAQIGSEKIEKFNEISYDPVDQKSRQRAKFDINKTVIKGISVGSQGILAFTPLIVYNHESSFEIKIKTMSYSVKIGIAEKDHIVNADLLEDTDIYYKNNGNQGKKYPAKVIEGKGFAEGDIVKTIVNRKQGTVEWKVNGITQAKANNMSILKESDKVFVPFITLFCDDEIEWLGCD